MAGCGTKGAYAWSQELNFVVSHKSKTPEAGAVGIQLSLGRTRNCRLPEQPAGLLPLRALRFLQRKATYQAALQGQFTPVQAAVAKAAWVARALLETERWASASPGPDGTAGLKALGRLTVRTLPRGWTHSDLQQHAGFPCPKPHP